MPTINRNIKKKVNNNNKSSCHDLIHKYEREVGKNVY